MVNKLHSYVLINLNNKVWQTFVWKRKFTYETFHFIEHLILNSLGRAFIFTP